MNDDADDFDALIAEFEHGEFDDMAASITLPSPADPMAVARRFVAEHHTRDDVALLRHHADGFYRWDGTCWPEVRLADVRSAFYPWTEHALYMKARPTKRKSTSGESKKSTGDSEVEFEPVPWSPNRYKVADAIDALRAVAHVDSTVRAPAWLDGDHEHDARDLVPMRNGLLHVPTRTLHEHTPSLWVHHALPFDYEPDAPEPSRWLAFMRELWDDDDESIETLQEAFGYLVSGDTRQQKIVLVVGPKRSGKGTIGRVATGLLGAHNVAAPTLAALATNFGLAPLIDRPLALVSDARLSGRADTSVVVERLLSVSGEDALTIDRKYREPWTGQLPTRFVILSNELPRLTDSSGALASRLVVLCLTRSFYGSEDPSLTRRLLDEAPGILNWALDGSDRLTARGHFTQPAASLDAIDALDDLASPVATFVRDRCEVGPAHTVFVDVLYRAWRAWCHATDDEPGTREIFGRDLRAALPTVHKRRGRKGEHREHYYEGIRLDTTRAHNGGTQ